MLNEMEKDGLDHIACWESDGCSFVVKKPQDFETQILPFYFQQSKLTSFQRQLNLYGFSKIKIGKGKGGYYHNLFRRDNQDMSVNITRLTSTKSTVLGKPTSSRNGHFKHIDSSGSVSFSIKQGESISVTTANGSRTHEKAMPFPTNAAPNAKNLHPLCRFGLKKPKLLSIEAFRASIGKESSKSSSLFSLKSPVDNLDLSQRVRQSVPSPTNFSKPFLHMPGNVFHVKRKSVDQHLTPSFINLRGATVKRCTTAQMA